MTAAARAGSLWPSRPCRRRRAAAASVHRRLGGGGGGRGWRVWRWHWRLSLWVEHPRGHRAGMTTPEVEGRGGQSAARAGRAAVRVVRPRGGGGGCTRLAGGAAARAAAAGVGAPPPPPRGDDDPRGGAGRWDRRCAGSGRADSRDAARAESTAAERARSSRRPRCHGAATPRVECW